MLRNQTSGWAYKTTYKTFKIKKPNNESVKIRFLYPQLENFTNCYKK